MIVPDKRALRTDYFGAIPSGHSTSFLSTTPVSSLNSPNVQFAEVLPTKRIKQSLYIVPASEFSMGQRDRFPVIASKPGLTNMQ